MKKYSMVFIGSLVGMVLALIALPSVANAHGDEKHDEPAATQAQQTKPQATPAQYSYKAKAGDAYSILARKAVQTYGIETRTNLSGAQIIFAETGLTQEAHASLLEVGQTVSINKDSVKAWVEKAKKLTPSEVTAWNYYVQFVDFDTRDNG